MNLYQISKETQEKMMALSAMIENGQVPTNQELDEFVDLQGDLKSKLVGYGYVVRNLNADLLGVDSEIERLTAIKKARKTHIEILQNRMKMAMNDNGLVEVDIDPSMPIKLKINPPSVDLIDGFNVETLPSEFVRTKKEVDKTALKKAIQGGAKFDGVSLVKNQSIKVG